MNPTALRLFALIDAARITPAMLGTSRQAWSIARKRGTLSDALCIRVCSALRLDPAQTIAALHRDDASTPEARAVWQNICERITNAPAACDSARQTDQPRPNSPRNRPPNDLYYVKSQTRTENASGIIHGMTSLKIRRIENATTLAKWSLCVPKISPASPRFVYYADNWHVLDKIRAAEISGELPAIIANSPAFTPAELRAALDYIDSKGAHLANANSGQTRPASQSDISRTPRAAARLS